MATGPTESQYPKPSLQTYHTSLQTHMSHSIQYYENWTWLATWYKHIDGVSRCWLPCFSCRKWISQLCIEGPSIDNDCTWFQYQPYLQLHLTMCHIHFKMLIFYYIHTKFDELWHLLFADNKNRTSINSQQCQPGHIWNVSDHYQQSSNLVRHKNLAGNKHGWYEKTRVITLHSGKPSKT